MNKKDLGYEDKHSLNRTSFYIAIAFCDSREKTIINQKQMTLPTNSTNNYKLKERNAFGKFILKFGTCVNSIEEISVKIGIDDNRLKDLYPLRGLLEAYELLLIEKAVGKKQGELFEEIYSQKQARFHKHNHERICPRNKTTA